MFRVLGYEEEHTKCYLANVQILSKVNHSTIAGFFNDSLRVIWPEKTLYDKVLLAITDAALYMCKAMTVLKVLYPKMVHVTCLARGLHRVFELVHSNYPTVNR